MKKLIVLLLMILPLGAIAQEVKIAFVKTQEVFMAMPEVSGMEKQMADLNEKYRVELKQMQDEYQKKYSDFVAQQDSLTENIKLRRMQEIQDIQERMDNFVQENLFYRIKEGVFSERIAPFVLYKRKVLICFHKLPVRSVFLTQVMADLRFSIRSIS